MHIFKGIVAMLICIAMALAVVPGLTVTAETAADGFNYQVHDDHVEITGYTGSAAELVIPDEINGLPVTGITKSAFYQCTSLTSINIPSGVTSIGDLAFYHCTSLTSINIPSGVTSIGDWAFVGCTSLISVNLPDGVMSIGDWAFYGCTSLTSINIPESVLSIGDLAFAGCTSLTGINLPAGITSIGDAAFAGCISITEFEISEYNTNYRCIDGALYNKSVTELIQYPPGSEKTSFTVPDGVVSIAYTAFRGCTGLEHISIPNGVTFIDDRAFTDCTSLISISIPSSVTKIDSDAFYGCAKLTDVYYGGSEAAWSNIYICGGNYHLDNAAIHYNSTGRGSDISVLVNNSPITFDVPPQIIDGATMLPVRQALEPLGAQLAWNGETQTVTVNAAGKTVVLTVGADTAVVNGEEKTLPVPAMIIDGRTLVPLRFVSEQLGFAVDWNSETNTVYITAP
ncbi:MAG: leucine-rich repeat protein [Oscillospiraceae bacterium]|nr:leucine-rich repeat protein [Oscillospiraceae bacterium]